MMNSRKRNASPVSSSVSQARLDRAANPTGVYLRTYVRWLNRLTDQETWPSQMLKARQLEMQPELAELKRICTSPPDSLTGPEWWKLAERWDKLRAQERALEEILDRRMWAARGGATSTHTRKPPITTVVLEPGSDPFENE